MAELAALGATIAATAAEAGITASGVATAASVAASAAGAAGAIQAGKQQKSAAEFNAAEMERSATESRAEASKRSRMRREELSRVQSRQRAVAAASGAGTDGEGYLDLIGDTAARGEEQALGELYIGEQKARGREGQAAISRWSGEQAVKKSYITAAGHGLDAIKAGVKGSNWLDSEDDIRYARKPGPWRTTTTYS